MCRLGVRSVLVAIRMLSRATTTRKVSAVTISILKGFKRKGMASFTDSSIVFSFILILLLVIFLLF